MPLLLPDMVTVNLRCTDGTKTFFGKILQSNFPEMTLYSSDLLNRRGGSKWLYVSWDFFFSHNISPAGPDQSARKRLLSFVRFYGWSLLPTPFPWSQLQELSNSGERENTGSFSQLSSKAPPWKPSSLIGNFFCLIGSRNLAYWSSNSSPPWTSSNFLSGVPFLSRTGCSSPETMFVSSLTSTDIGM